MSASRGRVVHEEVRTRHHVVEGREVRAAAGEAEIALIRAEDRGHRPAGRGGAAESSRSTFGRIGARLEQNPRVGNAAAKVRPPWPPSPRTGLRPGSSTCSARRTRTSAGPSGSPSGSLRALFLLGAILVVVAARKALGEDDLSNGTVVVGGLGLDPLVSRSSHGRGATSPTISPTPSRCRSWPPRTWPEASWPIAMTRRPSG